MNQAGSEGKPFYSFWTTSRAKVYLFRTLSQQSDVLFAIGEVTNINPEDHDHDIPLTRDLQPLEEYAKCFGNHTGGNARQALYPCLTVATPIGSTHSLKEILLI